MKTYIHTLLLLLLLPLVALGQQLSWERTFSQALPRMMQDPLVKVATDHVGHLFLDVNATAFLCDAEYFLPRTEGYTYVGSRLIPALRYVINEQVSFRGGVVLTALAGREGLWKAQPMLTFDFVPAQWLHLVMGTINGGQGHHLDAPLYNPNRWYYAYKEDGVQLLTTTSYWQSDTWVDWEHFLEPWTPDQERFTLGSRHELFLFNQNHPERHHWQISMPLAFVGSHRGGQVSTLDTCIETLFNEQLGLRAAWLGEAVSFGIQLPLYLYQNGSPQGERYRPFDQGFGLWPSANITISFLRSLFEVQAGFWRGSQFLSLHGNYLFMSVSDHKADYLQPDVHLLTLHLGYEYHFQGFDFALNFQGYYDIDFSRLDLSVGLSLAFGHSFRLF